MEKFLALFSCTMAAICTWTMIYNGRKIAHLDKCQDKTNSINNDRFQRTRERINRIETLIQQKHWFV